MNFYPKAVFGFSVVASLALLLGCTDTNVEINNDNSPPGNCKSFKAANATVSTTINPGCADCSAANANNAIDDSLTTSATLTVNGAVPTQGAAIRATAQSGIVFPAGPPAGAFISVPAGVGQSYTVVVRTLLAGAVQESTSSNTSNGVGGGNGGSFTGVPTSKPFDAVEVFISNLQAGVAPQFEVFEICSDYRS